MLDQLRSGPWAPSPVLNQPDMGQVRHVDIEADKPSGWGLPGDSRAQCLHLALFLQFADGVYLVLLMGLLEGYFVPLHSFFLTPDSFEQKVRRGDVEGGPNPHALTHPPTAMLGPSGEKAVASCLPMVFSGWMGGPF